MSLSIFDAALETPGKTAVIAEGQAYSFQDIARLTARALGDIPPEDQTGRWDLVEPVPMTGHADLPTLINLYSLFESGIPALLLHPRWTDRERSDALRHLPVRLDVTTDHPLAIVHTSGSTNRPKGVILSRRAFEASAAASAANFGWNDDDRWLLNMPLAHIGGLSIVTRTLIARRTIVLASHFDPAATKRAIDEHRITILSLVPAMLRRMIDHSTSWRPPRHLRVVLVGGAPFPRALHREAAERGLPVLSTYGLTEGCSQIATTRYGDSLFAESGVRPLDGADVRIVDGLLEIRGAMLMNGYLGDPEGESPFTLDGWFRTGDLGRIDEEGKLHVLGRRDEVIISGGENVSVFEVEEILLQLPGMSEACVYGVPDSTWGEIVCAAVVPEPGASLDFDMIAPLLNENLASFKRPRRFLVLDDIPRDPSGKPDRRALTRSSVV